MSFHEERIEGAVIDNVLKLLETETGYKIVHQVAEEFKISAAKDALSELSPERLSQEALDIASEAMCDIITALEFKKRGYNLSRIIARVRFQR